MTYGSVLRASVSEYNAKKGDTTEKKYCLIFLVLEGKTGFTAVALSLDNFDIKTIWLYPEDPVVRLIDSAIDEKKFDDEWFEGYLKECKIFLLPRVLVQYKEHVGEDWGKIPKLKLKTPTKRVTKKAKSASKKKEGSSARGTSTAWKDKEVAVVPDPKQTKQFTLVEVLQSRTGTQSSKQAADTTAQTTSRPPTGSAVSRLEPIKNWAPSVALPIRVRIPKPDPQVAILMDIAVLIHHREVN